MSTLRAMVQGEIEAWLEKATIEELAAENQAIEIAMISCSDFDEQRRLGLLKSVVCSRKHEAHKRRTQERKATRASAPPPPAPPVATAQQKARHVRRERAETAFLYHSLYASASRQLRPAPSEPPEQFAARVRKWADAMMLSAEQGLAEQQAKEENPCPS